LSPAPLNWLNCAQGIALIATCEAVPAPFRSAPTQLAVALPHASYVVELWDLFRRAGIENIPYNVRPAGEWLPEVSNTGNYDFCCVGHPAEDTPHRPLKLNHSNTGMIHQSFNIGDPEVDEAIDHSETAADWEEHVEAVKQAQRLLLEKYAHMSYIYTAQVRALLWNYVRDWEFNPATHAMHRTEVWLDR
jgi:ABC-type oligopeptide transport system substrate-binding subunit